MKTRDLIAELDTAQRALRADHRVQLHGLGIPHLIIERGLIGAGRIQLSANGRAYEPAEDGAQAFVTPCRIGTDLLSPEDPDHESVPQFGCVIDLVAWSPRYPGRWALRSGLAAWLGAIPPQFCSPPPVTMRRDVFSWLRAGASGLCILAHERRDAYRVLSVCRDEIKGEDHDHVRELRRIFEQPFSTPRISAAATAPMRAA